MFDYVKGSIAELSPTDIVVDCNNIGFHAQISLQTYSDFEHSKECKLYLHHVLREDEELFYGFSSKDEREMFRLLINVSGVGVGTARMMLSSLSCEEVREAILSENVNRIKSVKGIGLKTAQRLVLELKDKIFFFNDTATTEIYTLSLHDALPISSCSECSQNPPPQKRQKKIATRQAGSNHHIKQLLSLNQKI